MASECLMILVAFKFDCVFYVSSLQKSCHMNFLFQLQEALIMFPGLLIPLLDKCNVVPDPKVEKHGFFGHKAQTQ